MFRFRNLLFALLSKTTKTSLGSLPRLFMTWNNCSNSLLWVLSFYLAKVRTHKEKFFRHADHVYYTIGRKSKSAKNCNASSDVKIKIISLSPTPLSYTKKGSPFVVVRYACGRSGMSSLWAGVGGMFLSWWEWRTFLRRVSSNGRFAATPSEVFRSSVPSICCAVFLFLQLVFWSQL